MFIHYKINYLLKRAGFTGRGSWIFKRDNLQVIVFIILFFLSLPQTKLQAKKDPAFYGQKTIAYGIFGTEEEYNLEEISASPASTNFSVPTWRQGALGSDLGSGLAGDAIVRDQELAGIIAGGTALGKPILMPGAAITGKRSGVVEYEVQPGDSLSSIAYEYGVSVATVMWENNLSLRSVLKLGQKLRIPPTTGVMHTIKKGDTIKKIAKQYSAKEPDIIDFNKLKEDGTDLKIGERIMVPGGIQPQAAALARTSRTSGTLSTRVAPAGSTAAASARGFVWPSKARTITQYYNWAHHAIDISGGGMGTPTYAAKAGTVVVSQCGWNSGYGCYVIIDHGNGVRTLYGHHSQLLVSPGDYVEAGQTIGLMGNTGKVRGVTGIHLHFEIQINGVRVNPLGYVR